MLSFLFLALGFGLGWYIRSSRMVQWIKKVFP